LAMLALGLGGAVGCGGGPAGGRPTDGGVDADAGSDAPMRVTCPAAAAGEKRGLGACCTEAANCADGVCWNGFCTKTCSGLQAGECGPITAPSPLPAGTQLTCAPNKVGDTFSYCLPGSLAACVATAAAPSASTCGAGESCALTLAAAATTVDGAAAGACLTKLVAAPGAAVGAACDADDGPYACEDEGGYLGSGCFAGRCTRACATSADCPGGLVCGPRPYSAKLGGIATFLMPPAPGLCQGVFCGQGHGQAGLAPGQPVQLGRDGACPSGQICVPTIAVGTTGDTQYLSCVPPRTGAVAYGMACSTTPGADNRCADDSLCVARSGTTFCSSLCASDVDGAAERVGRAAGDVHPAGAHRDGVVRVRARLPDHAGLLARR
jgi:hypothetical protein